MRNQSSKFKIHDTKFFFQDFEWKFQRKISKTLKLKMKIYEIIHEKWVTKIKIENKFRNLRNCKNEWQKWRHFIYYLISSFIKKYRKALKKNLKNWKKIIKKVLKIQKKILRNEEKKNIYRKIILKIQKKSLKKLIKYTKKNIKKFVTLLTAYYSFE